MSKNKTSSPLVSVSLRQVFSTPIIVCLVIFAIYSLLTQFIDIFYYDIDETLFSNLQLEAKTTDPNYCILMPYESVYIGLALGFLLGFFQFGFLSDKNACYTRLSFGTKRKAIFYSNAFYPLACTFFIIVVSKLLSVIVNVYYLGLHSNIIKMFFLSVLSSFIPIIFSFTVTTVANILTTRKIETALLTVSVIVLPFLLSALIRNIFTITLFGYGDDAYSFNEIYTLLEKLNPVEMIINIGDFDYFCYGITEEIAFGGEFAWCIFCICACIGAMLLTASFFEKRFMPENCGKKGVSKLSLTLISFTASVLVCLFILENTSSYYYYIDFQPPTKVILCVIFGTLSAILINLLTNLGKGKIKQGLAGAGFSILVQALIAVIGLTGCFGFSNKIPDAEDILEIRVLVPFDDMYEISSNYYFTDGSSYSYLDITDPQDFDIVREIHQSALNTRGVNETNVACDIEYVLKDKSTIKRYYYYVSEETAAKSIKLWDTKAVKEHYKVKLNQGEPETITVDSEIIKNSYLYNPCVPISTKDYITIVSKDNRMTELSPQDNISEKFIPTEDIKLEIMSALYKDICTLSAEEWFMPEKQYGALVFDTGTRSSSNSSVLLFEDVFSEYNSVFYINSNMKNTVSVLEKYDYMHFFDCFKTIENAHIVTADNLAKWVQTNNYYTEASESIYENTSVKHGTYYTVNNPGKTSYLVNGCEYSTTSYDTFYDNYTAPYDYNTIYEGVYADDVIYEPAPPPPIKEITNTAEAKDIKKYICVPQTTPFAVLYLATEGLYAEIASSKSGIAEKLQAQNVMVAGPSTITALLNSFAMGFKAMAINEKADEVRKLLSVAKSQYETFGTVLEKARKKIDEAGKSLDEAQKRNNIIQKKLKGVEAIDTTSAEQFFITDVADSDE